MFLKTLCEIRAGQTFKGSLDNYEPGEVTVVLPKDIVDGKIGDGVRKLASLEIPQLQKHVLKSGDILIANKGSKFSSYLHDDNGEPVVATTAFYVITPSEAIDPAFLHWYLNQDEAKHYFAMNATSSVMPLLTKKVLELLPVPVPVMEEQKKIAEFIELTGHEILLIEELLLRKKEFAENYIWERILKSQN